MILIILQPFVLLLKESQNNERLTSTSTDITDSTVGMLTTVDSTIPALAGSDSD
jgi:hypothetical protein